MIAEVADDGPVVSEQDQEMIQRLVNGESTGLQSANVDIFAFLLVALGNRGRDGTASLLLSARYLQFDSLGKRDLAMPMLCHCDLVPGLYKICIRRDSNDSRYPTPVQCRNEIISHCMKYRKQSLSTNF